MPFPSSYLAEPQVCVYISGDSADQAYQIIQEYAVATTWFMVGQRLWSAHGADAIRRILLLNDARGRRPIRVLLDARLYGDATELPDIVNSMYASGVRGTTVSAASGADALRAVVATAGDIAKTDRAGFGVIGYGDPELRAYRSREGDYTDARVRCLCYAASTAGVDMLLVQRIDYQTLRDTLGPLPVCVKSQRAARDHNRIGAGPGVRDWIRAGVNFVMYDPVALCGARWGEDDAELLRVETTMAIEKPHKAVTNAEIVRQALLLRKEMETW